MNVEPVVGEQVNQNIAALTVRPYADVPDKTNSIFVKEHIIFLSGLRPIRYSLAVIIPYTNRRQKAIVNIDKKTIFFTTLDCAIFYTI